MAEHNPNKLSHTKSVREFNVTDYATTAPRHNAQRQRADRRISPLCSIFCVYTVGATQLLCEFSGSTPLQAR